ncbi:class I SAM-dependent methyltransferase [Micromonospora sp. PLK6-60]|uniref:SAM-dependent methyltransferase n=1 Tax=Micromonospora sp. PLK6-60 TaxID=2873383 RepID=UPI001CA755B6|nr:class I SAM-dependent methyltransferase [Micromonospora sp. PLK6-60]MBY8871691.1 class I SAM-dependent methyltransferase [Micromonospora sp. PLK6-60]
MTALDLPRSFVIREGDLRILNPYDAGKLATLGRALKLRPGTSILDLCSGKGELLCTWARDHGVVGTGVDISTAFTAAARERAAELGVADRVRFAHGDAAVFVPESPVDVAACVGATWIGGGVPGTLEILARSLRPGGMALVGEPYWRREPPDEDAVRACHAESREDFHDLPGLVALFGDLGWDLVEMVLADQDSWDRYAAAHWLNLRRWLDANPDDELAGELRRELTEDPLRHVRFRRELLGWGVFALLRR